MTTVTRRVGCGNRWGGLGEERRALPPSQMTRRVGCGNRWGGLGEERRALPPSQM
jgi:hypothetical protein